MDDEPVVVGGLNAAEAARQAAQTLVLAAMEPNPDMVRAKSELAGVWVMLTDTLINMERGSGWEDD